MEASSSASSSDVAVRGKVKKVCQDWQVLEDAGLAYNLQNVEISEHYDRNRCNNRVRREDHHRAREVQQTEEEILMEMIREQEERDAMEAALLIEHEEEKLKEEQRRMDEDVARRLAMEERDEVMAREQQDRELALMIHNKQKAKLRKLKEAKRLAEEEKRRKSVLEGQEVEDGASLASHDADYSLPIGEEYSVDMIDEVLYATAVHKDQIRDDASCTVSSRGSTGRTTTRPPARVPHNDLLYANVAPITATIDTVHSGSSVDSDSIYHDPIDRFGHSSIYLLKNEDLTKPSSTSNIRNSTSYPESISRIEDEVVLRSSVANGADRNGNRRSQVPRENVFADNEAATPPYMPMQGVSERMTPIRDKVSPSSSQSSKRNSTCKTQ